MTTFQERHSSGRSVRGPSGSVELLFDGQAVLNSDGTSDAAQVHDDFDSFAPATYDGIPLSTTIVEVEELANGLYRCEARYTPSSGGGSFPNGYPRRFSTGGGSERIKESLETLNSYGAGAPDFGRAIGVSRNNVEGADVFVPVRRFNETHEFTPAQVTTAFETLLGNLTGTINDAPFRGRAAGEVLFEGVDGDYNPNSGLWALTFSFAIKPNRNGIQIGSISGVAARGWDYVWALYLEEEEASAGLVIPQAAAVYVERVYADGDFDGLGI